MKNRQVKTGWSLDPKSSSHILWVKRSKSTLVPPDKIGSKELFLLYIEEDGLYYCTNAGPALDGIEENPAGAIKIL